MTIKEIEPLIQVTEWLKQGKEVEYRWKDYSWVNYYEGAAFDPISEFTFRIKPKPDPYQVFRDAQKEGKVVEFRCKDRNLNNDRWLKADRILSNDNDILDKYKFRIKPTPTIRPWRPEEVPVGALIRPKMGGWTPRVILYYGKVSSNSSMYVCYPFVDTFTPPFSGDSLGGCLENREHSLDHGKTWLPCGVLSE